jgi:ribosomal protein L34E
VAIGKSGTLAVRLGGQKQDRRAGVGDPHQRRDGREFARSGRAQKQVPRPSGGVVIAPCIEALSPR